MTGMDTAAATIEGVLTDLREVSTRLASRAAADPARLVGILDDLAGELAEAAALIRAEAGLPAPDPGPGVAMPGGGWISGPSH